LTIIQSEVAYYWSTAVICYVLFAFNNSFAKSIE